jgi:N-acetylglutamate synthase-like GNAT family acetyltransferase
MDRSRSAIFARRHDDALKVQGSPPLFVPEPDQVRTATAKDRTYIDSLQKKFANCLGFLPNEALDVLIEMGATYTAIENGDPAGYIVSRPHLRWQPLMRSITQTCVAMDAQRRHHGLALLDVISAEAAAAGLRAIQACCAVGLESNEFWRAAGFIPICHMTPENVRAREVICWRRPLSTVVPTWFAMPPLYSGVHGKRTKSNRNPNRSTDATNTARQYLTAQTGYEAAEDGQATAEDDSSGEESREDCEIL